jgi:hypothetical protein
MGHPEVMSSVPNFNLYDIHIHSQQEGQELYTMPLCYSFDWDQGPRGSVFHHLIALGSKTLFFCGFVKHVTPDTS